VYNIYYIIMYRAITKNIIRHFCNTPKLYDRIVDYKVIMVASRWGDFTLGALDNFENEINKLIKQGYEPYGNIVISSQPVTSSSNHLAQVMVKRTVDILNINESYHK
jgi:hypothetical protein